NPQFWLVAAELAKMDPGLNIPLSLSDLMQAGQMAGAQHGAFIPPGVVMPMMLHGGSHGEIVAPLGKLGSGSGGGWGDVHIHIDNIDLGKDVTRADVKRLVDDIEHEMTSRRRRG